MKIWGVDSNMVHILLRFKELIFSESPIRIPPLHVYLPGAGTANPVRAGSLGRLLPRGRRLAPILVQGEVRVPPEERPGIPLFPSNACSSLALSCLLLSLCTHAADSYCSLVICYARAATG